MQSFELWDHLRGFGFVLLDRSSHSFHEFPCKTDSLREASRLLQSSWSTTPEHYSQPAVLLQWAVPISGFLGG